MIHVDATFVIDFLRESYRRRPGAATEFLASLHREEIVVSVFVACELFAGVHYSRHPERERERVSRFCHDFRIVYPNEIFAETYGGIQSLLQRTGKIIGTMDLLIASLALVEGSPLLTRNVRHFDRIPELKILTY